MPIIRNLLCSAAICLAATTAIAVSAAGAETLKATWTDPDNPEIAPVSAYMHVFQDSLQRFSGGEYQVQLYPNGQLGDQRSMVEQIRHGSLHFANIASGVLASLYYPKLGILDMPFLFKSRAEFNAAMDPNDPMIKELLDDVAKQSGVRIVALLPYGFRDFTNKQRVVKSPDDMKGLRIRTMEIVPNQKMVEALGATPVPIPYLELYTSLQTGVVDGQENPPSNILMQKFYQVQKHMTLDHHTMTVGAVITNEKWWQSLSDDQRKEILSANAEAHLAHDGIGAVRDLLGVQEIRDKGVDVYVPTPEDIKKFRDATVPPVEAWMKEQYGDTFVNDFLAHMKQVSDRF